jgi:hypothetical protein
MPAGHTAAIPNDSHGVPAAEAYETVLTRAKITEVVAVPQELEEWVLEKGSECTSVLIKVRS